MTTPNNPEKPPRHRSVRAGRWIAVFVIVIAILLVTYRFVIPFQEGDSSFDSTVRAPAYSGNHPRVLFDNAHYNIHKSSGRYKPFVDLISNDGYTVVANAEPFSESALERHDILVVANALGFRGAAQQIANLLRLEGKVDFDIDAFSSTEVRAVTEWVRHGGALLLIADHAPCGEAARSLARAFSVEMTDGYVEDPRHHDPRTDVASFLVYARMDGTLLEHAITSGRSADERLSTVVSFTGQSLRVPEGAVPFLRLSESAIHYPARRAKVVDRQSAVGLAQGVALQFGAGRVVVLGEAAMLTSQVTGGGSRTFRMGLAYPGYDNRQLALNIMHWLSRLIP